MLQLAGKVNTIGKKSKYKSQVKREYRTPRMSPTKHKSNKYIGNRIGNPTGKRVTRREQVCNTSKQRVLPNNVRTIRIGK